jgi:VIT1/CCC1 family predicted Fe2+/Mn2+ transporter
MKKYLSPSRVRSFIFGVEDSLVSTVGLLSGVAAAGMSRPSILLTGVVLIFVEAFSMGVGDLLSGHAAEEYEKKTQVSLTHALPEGTVMFFSYLISGFIPLFPYIIVEPAQAF